MGSDAPKKETPPSTSEQNQNKPSEHDQNLEKLNNPLIKSIVEDMTGKNKISNKEDDEWINLDMDNLGINGGNDSSNNKIENQKIEHKLENKKKIKKFSDKLKNKNMSNKKRNEINANINITNYETNNIQMLSSARDFYPKKNKNNDDIKKEEDKNEDNKISNIKKISKNFHLDNEENEKDDIKSERKKIFKKKVIKKGKTLITNYNNNNPINTEENINIKKPEININLENDNNIQDNININNEIEQQEKINEDDLDINLQINKEVEKNRISINIDYQQLFLNNKIPRKVFLFDNPNIFDSFLIILNNNYYISKYLAKNEEIIKNYILKCEKTETYCLIGLLYYINKYLWTARAEEIKPKNELRLLYLKFMDCYVQVNCKNKSPDSYLNDSNNIYIIIGFIFQRINEEFTKEKKNTNKKKEFKSGNMQLNKYMNNYMKSHISVVSDFFTVFLLEETSCLSCRDRMNRYYNNYLPNKEYSDFNFIYLDLSNNMPRINMNSSINFNNYGNFNNNNQFNKSDDIYTRIEMDLTRIENSNCPICCFNTKKYIQKQFYSLPNVLTIILQNNNGSFKLDDEINLSKYTHISGNYNYYLIAILCKYNYNDKYITYCFNHRDGDWYYYTSNENSVHKVTSLDLNAIPLTLVYQNTEGMEFKYNKINLDKINNKKGYLFRFQKQRPQITLYFGDEATVKDAKIDVENYFNLKNVRFSINGEIGKNNDKLSDVADNTFNRAIIVICDES